MMCTWICNVRKILFELINTDDLIVTYKCMYICSNFLVTCLLVTPFFGCHMYEKYLTLLKSICINCWTQVKNGLLTDLVICILSRINKSLKKKLIKY